MTPSTTQQRPSSLLSPTLIMSLFRILYDCIHAEGHDAGGLVEESSFVPLLLLLRPLPGAWHAMTCLHLEKDLASPKQSVLPRDSPKQLLSLVRPVWRPGLHSSNDRLPNQNFHQVAALFFRWAPPDHRMQAPAWLLLVAAFILASAHSVCQRNRGLSGWSPNSHLS